MGNLAGDEIYLRSGLLQGSILSPILYTQFINDITYTITNSKASLIKSPNIENLNEYEIPLFLFADDIAIYGQCSKDLQLILNAVQKHVNENNYKFNTLKSVILSNQDYNFTLNNEQISICANFEYLGVSMNINGINAKAHTDKLYKK